MKGEGEGEEEGEREGEGEGEGEGERGEGERGEGERGEGEGIYAVVSMCANKHTQRSPLTGLLQQKALKLGLLNTCE